MRPAGGNVTGYRPAMGRETQSGDELPTREVLDWVKAEAWRRVSLKAFGLQWPPSETTGQMLVKVTPAVALMALTKLCPTVPLWRAAACLQLDARTAGELWNQSSSLGAWAGEQAAEIASLVAGVLSGGEGGAHA